MAETRFLNALAGGQKPGFLSYLSVEKQKLWQKPDFSTLLLGVRNRVSQAISY
ncbi:hypothetical protein [Planktothrix mougeotii]|uniref:Uncharacterized protein n=1 Tax=Planktothrix mougeotii LEGE 06226 TaxID=1828728 RepID=A0ABR9UIZ6_9CYAN|nr:hypothetical protein [Planktothrix mougeotii]MBE9146439.1 hypothetical protein [Planktothrix mougeotii LEGE 06226]